MKERCIGMLCKNRITIYGNSDYVNFMLEKISGEKTKDYQKVASIDFNKIMPIPEEIKHRIKCLINNKVKAKFEIMNWCVRNWGTPSNAYDFKSSFAKNNEELKSFNYCGRYVYFKCTSPVKNIVIELSKQFPKATLEYAYEFDINDKNIVGSFTVKNNSISNVEEKVLTNKTRSSEYELQLDKTCKIIQMEDYTNNNV